MKRRLKIKFHCKKIQDVTLQNIRYIGENAFENCYNLESVSINGDIQELYSYTFESCLNLRCLIFKILLFTSIGFLKDFSSKFFKLAYIYLRTSYKVRSIYASF